MAQQRNAAAELRRNLQAIMKMAPEQYMSEAQLAPLYTGLQLQNTDMLLNGAPSQDFTYYDWVRPTYKNVNGRVSGGDSMFGIPGMSGMGLPGMGGGSGGLGIPGLSGGFDMPGMPGFPGMGGDSGGMGIPGLDGLFGGDDKPQKKLLTAGHYEARTSNRPAQRGLLDMQENDVTPALARMQSKTREADIADVMRLGPQARLAMRAANPDNAALLDTMNSQANNELSMGASLDPALRRVVEQSIRSRQSGTMLSNGNAGAYDEAMGMSMFGNDLRDRRRNFASGVVGLNQAVYGNPLEAVLGRSAGAGSTAMQASQIASGISGMLGPKFTDPMNSYMQDLNSSNANANWAADIASKNRSAALTAAGISAAGSVLGGASSMI